MIVNEPDGIARIDLLKRDGTAAESDVYATVASEIVQPGDQIGAAFANLVSRLSDDADPVPELYLDVGTAGTRIGTLRLLHGPTVALPTTAEHGEAYVTDEGVLYLADNAGAWVRAGNQEAIDEVTAALTAHINRRDNPHVVTLAQLGAAAASTVNSHINNRSNPHQVTAAQAGALPLTGGVMEGSMELRQADRIRFRSTDTFQADCSIYCAIRPDDQLYYQILEQNLTQGVLVRNLGDGSLSALFSSTTVGPSSLRYKENIKPAEPNSAEVLKDIEVVEFDYKKSTPFASENKEIGAIAEEVVKVAPYCVFKNKEGEVDGINYAKLVPLLILDSQEKSKQIAALEARIEALEK